MILVADIINNKAKIIVESPNEGTLSKKDQEKYDRAIEQKANELFQQYPPDTYEVICIRISDMDDLIQAFPEFSGWEMIVPEQLTIK